MDEECASHIHEKYPNHVPACLLAFYEVSDYEETMALVLRCKPRTAKNVSRDSVLIESWNLETIVRNYSCLEDGQLVEEDVRGQPVVTRLEYFYYAGVPLSNIKEGVYVIPENNIFLEHMKNSEETGHVQLVKDRKMHWAHEFL